VRSSDAIHAQGVTDVVSVDNVSVHKLDNLLAPNVGVYYYSSSSELSTLMLSHLFIRVDIQYDKLLQITQCLTRCWDISPTDCKHVLSISRLFYVISYNFFTCPGEPRILIASSNQSHAVQ